MEHPDRVPDPGARCPCGTGRTYGECCGPIHAGVRPAATAEQLMRSRYSAFAVGDAGYLARSWHPATRPRRVRVYPDDVWLGLEVRRTERGGLADDEGIVELGPVAGGVATRSRWRR